MTRDFPDFKFPTLDGEETVVGVHHSGMQLEEGTNTSGGRYYCTNCKKKIHCYVKVDRETNEATVHNTCKDKICECKCKTHYSCRQCGYLHPYGEKCSKVEVENMPDPKSEKAFQKLMDKWKKQQEANNAIT